MIEGLAYALLPIFRAVAAAGGFTAASGPLGITPSAVSQKIRQLESELGIRLFERTSRSVRLTAAGQVLLDGTSAAFDELAAAFDQAHSISHRAAGSLRINLSRLAAEVCLLPRLPGFLSAYPDIALELSTDDRLTDIVAEGFDAGIRMTETLEQDMIARPIGPPLRRSVFASTQYVQRRGLPEHPSQLSSHDVIRYRFPGSKRLEPLVFSVGDQIHHLDPPPRMVLDDNSHIRLALREGFGIAQRFRATEETEIKSGRLVELLVDFEPPPMQFYLYYPSRNQPTKLKVFIDWFAN